MKFCKACGQTKRFIFFHKDAKSKDGLLGICKLCNISRVKKYRLKNIEKIRAYDRQRAPTHTHSAEFVQKYNKEQSHKRRAKWAVENAIRCGKLVRPKKCQKCKKQQRIYGHHEDYSKQLSVWWLCQPCHMKRHRELRCR